MVASTNSGSPSGVPILSIRVFLGFPDFWGNLTDLEKAHQRLRKADLEYGAVRQVLTLQAVPGLDLIWFII